MGDQATARAKGEGGALTHRVGRVGPVRCYLKGLLHRDRGHWILHAAHRLRAIERRRTSTGSPSRRAALRAARRSHCEDRRVGLSAVFQTSRAVSRQVARIHNGFRRPQLDERQMAARSKEEVQENTARRELTT